MITTGSIVLIALAFVLGAFIGVLLGRRSDRANAYTDEIMVRLKAAEAKIKALKPGN